VTAPREALAHWGLSRQNIQLKRQSSVGGNDPEV